MTDAAWIALGLLKHVGGKTMRALMAGFHGDPHAVLAADSADLRKIPGVGPKIAAAIQAIDLPRIEQSIERWIAAGVHIITLEDGDYPARLRALHDAPPVLFCHGQHPPPGGPFAAVALVGTRKPSNPARAAASRLGMDLAAADYTVVSGLALGIDAAAHMGALAVSDGRTLAVLGSGVLNIYPPNNRSLAEAVMGRGSLVCEVRPDVTVSAASLVARNRIISGLCEALVVIETAADGGAMHAARFAKAQGRRIYTLDLPASGNRALIASGATCLPVDVAGTDWM